MDPTESKLVDMSFFDDFVTYKYGEQSELRAAQGGKQRRM
jgi:hypothetical protein